MPADYESQEVFNSAPWSQLESVFVESFLNDKSDVLGKVVSSPAFRSLSPEDIKRLYQKVLDDIAIRYNSSSSKQKAGLLEKVVQLAGLGVNLNESAYSGQTYLNRVLAVSRDPLFLGLLIKLGADTKTVSNVNDFNQVMAPIGYQIK